MQATSVSPLLLNRIPKGIGKAALTTVMAVEVSGGTGNDIQVVLAEESEFQNWINGHQTHALYSTPKVTAGRINVAIREPGTYYLAFTNSFSVFSSKTVTADIELR